MKEQKKAMAGISWIIAAILGILLLFYAPALVAKTYDVIKRADIDLDFNDKYNADKQQTLAKLRDQANQAFLTGNYKKASDIYQQLIDEDSSKQIVYTSYYEIAKSFYSTGQYAKALQYYRYYLDQDKKDNLAATNNAYSDLLDIYLEKNIIEGGVEEATKLLKQYKDKIGENEHYKQMYNILKSRLSEEKAKEI